MSLADNVRKAALDSSAKQLPKGQNTSNLQEQIATTATGKAQEAGQNLKQSNIQEQLGMLEARDQVKQVQTQGLDAASELAAKEADAEIKQKEVQAANRIQEHQHEVAAADKMDQVMSEIEHSNQTLEDREDAMKLETVAADLRLKDKKYTHELQQAGKRDRLNESQRINRKMRQLKFGNATANAYEKLEIKGDQMIRARQAEETEEMMKLEEAFGIMDAKISDATQAAKISGVANMMKTGVSAYSAGKKSGFFDAEPDGGGGSGMTPQYNAGDEI